MACTRSTCRRGKKRQYCCTRIPNTTKRQCRRRRAPHVSFSLFTDDSQAHPPPDNWSDIGLDLLEQAYKWLSLADIIKCRAVCSWWRRCISQIHISSTTLNSSPTTTPPPIIWCQSYYFSKYLFLDHAKDTAAAGQLYSHQSLDQMGSCVGYSFGYFLSVDKDERLCLLRPLFSPVSTVRFPPISVPGKGSFWKAVLWADPISDTSRCGVVVVPFNSQPLMFAKCGDTQFSKLECQKPHRKPCTEIICINNFVYGISCSIGDHHMEAWDCNAGEDGPKKILDFQPAFSSGSVPPRCSSLHLVESRGELLLVAIKRLWKPTCMVYKMDFKEKKWLLMDSLGDSALFIFHYQTICLSTRKFPQYQKNTIYFDGIVYSLGTSSFRRLGVFNMEDGSWSEISHIKVCSTTSPS